MSATKNNHAHVLLLGNPNSGKSSLFNSLTGLRQKTGNYAGVTVDKYEGTFLLNNDGQQVSVKLTDLPGTYSLHAVSPDEKVTCAELLREEDRADLCLVVIDASNLQRGLMLASQIIDLKYPTIVVLNMMDEATKQGVHIDSAGLSKDLGVKVVEVSTKVGTGIEELKQQMLQAGISDTVFYDLTIHREKDFSYGKAISFVSSVPDATREFFRKDHLHRHRLMAQIAGKHVKEPAALQMRELTEKVDRWLTHRYFGYLFFLLILALVFQFIFYIAEWPMNWIESAFLLLRETITRQMPSGVLTDLLVNGVVAGISGVLIFVPQIALLFLFIAVLEDSGYMARAGFIMDKIMRKFGLNGRSVIPIISGTACAVPSIMAARSISDYKERLITIFILPLVSCSARLPVYTLLISLLFPSGSYGGWVLLFLYLLGFTLTLLTAFVLKGVTSTLSRSVYIMELPVYRRPQMRNVLTLVLNKVRVFVFDAGRIIVSISIVLWFLSNYGSGAAYESAKDKLEHPSSQLSQEEEASLRAQKLEHSYIGTMGHAIEPVIRPLGFDWKIGISLITSLAAREVFVGSMASIYGTTEENERIREILQKERDANGSPVFTPAVCWALLIFYAFALQCISTIATVKRETGGWKWAIIQFSFLTLLAYFGGYLAYHLFS